ncbi:uncharacterized protein E0L32_006648 [Thyridium curvatum]|uniref:Uncharacterized protein n=1 Tax=Thyridium curvatum TaxID=1093900 RepID=A0A507AZD3_9PEZI|nr:uncharacterized protein E0L32_006648 [Thyridium curvatum]TPX13003.1 hypothetical protein E0L32_006648 [Thyridium curvatum]
MDVSLAQGDTRLLASRCRVSPPISADSSLSDFLKPGGALFRPQSSDLSSDQSSAFGLASPDQSSTAFKLPFADQSWVPVLNHQITTCTIALYYRAVHHREERLVPPAGVAIGQTHQERVNYLTRARRVIVTNLLVQYKKPEQFRQMAIVAAREPELDEFLAFLESHAVAMTPELKKDGKVDVTLNAVIDPGMKVPDHFVQRSQALLDKFEDESWGGESDVDDEAEDDMEGEEATEEASTSAASPRWRLTSSARNTRGGLRPEGGTPACRRPHGSPVRQRASVPALGGVFMGEGKLRHTSKRFSDSSAVCSQAAAAEDQPGASEDQPTSNNFMSHRSNCSG